jgi:hypothetical protein
MSDRGLFTSSVSQTDGRPWPSQGVRFYLVIKGLDGNVAPTAVPLRARKNCVYKSCVGLCVEDLG